jgi:hypothetical protein
MRTGNNKENNILFLCYRVQRGIITTKLLSGRFSLKYRWPEKGTSGIARIINIWILIVYVCDNRLRILLRFVVRETPSLNETGGITFWKL